MRNLWRVLPLLSIGFLLAATPDTALHHERLRIKNTFKTPEEVVSYYCARDASGFVWSGFLEVERKAFTLWSEIPQQDSFYVAKKYEVHPPKFSDKSKDQAMVEVRYELLGIGDGHGTRTPAPIPEYVVQFDLKKINGAWKIAKPDAKDISPIVLESKFPVTIAEK